MLFLFSRCKGKEDNLYGKKVRKMAQKKSKSKSK